MLWCFTVPYPVSEIGKAERCQEIAVLEFKAGVILFYYVGICSPLPCVARRCSSIASRTSSLRKDPSQALQDSIREVCAVCYLQSTAVSFARW